MRRWAAERNRVAEKSGKADIERINCLLRPRDFANLRCGKRLPPSLSGRDRGMSGAVRDSVSGGETAERRLADRVPGAGTRKLPFSGPCTKCRAHKMPFGGPRTRCRVRKMPFGGPCTRCSVRKMPFGGPSARYRSLSQHMTRRYLHFTVPPLHLPRIPAFSRPRCI